MRAAVQAAPGGQGTAPESWLRAHDPVLVSVVAALLCLGLVMVASASISIAGHELEQPLHYFWRQLAFAGFGVGLMWGMLRTPLVVWHRMSPWLLLLGIALLALVLVPGVGREVNGSTRWLRLGAVNVQPSELVKLFMVLYLAGYLVRRGEEVRGSFAGFLKPVAVLALIAGLLLLEPDYGAAVVLFATALLMLFLGGVPIGTFAGWAGLAALLLGAIVLAAPYRVERLLSFLDPWQDPFGSGFQLTQALIAIGRGEWLGVGLGSSVQKLFYLPEAHTDFMFAVLAEELGLVGAATVILLFGVLTWRAMLIGRRAESRAHYHAVHLAYGLGGLVGLQAFVNIGVNMGMLPTKGLTLPLMSYGGSSLVVNCMAMGLLLRASFESRHGG